MMLDCAGIQLRLPRRSLLSLERIDELQPSLPDAQSRITLSSKSLRELLTPDRPFKGFLANDFVCPVPTTVTATSSYRRPKFNVDCLVLAALDFGAADCPEVGDGGALRFGGILKEISGAES